MYDLCSNRLIETFEKILKVNLTQDTFEIIKFNSLNDTDAASTCTRISEWFSAFALDSNVYSEDISTFKKYTSLSYLREFFKKSDNHWVQYRRLFGSEYYWSEMLMITAEDYTDDNQLELLKKLGCDYVQGYYFSKPLPADIFEKRLVEEI